MWGSERARRAATLAPSMTSRPGVSIVRDRISIIAGAPRRIGRIAGRLGALASSGRVEGAPVLGTEAVRHRLGVDSLGGSWRRLAREALCLPPVGEDGRDGSHRIDRGGLGDLTG